MIVEEPEGLQPPPPRPARHFTGRRLRLRRCFVRLERWRVSCIIRFMTRFLIAFFFHPAVSPPAPVSQVQRRPLVSWEKELGRGVGLRRGFACAFSLPTSQ